MRVRVAPISVRLALMQLPLAWGGGYPAAFPTTNCFGGERW